MSIYEILFVVAMIIIWGCFGISMLISSIQSIIYDRRSEKRERERDARDCKYHEERMKKLK